MVLAGVALIALGASVATKDVGLREKGYEAQRKGDNVKAAGFFEDYLTQQLSAKVKLTEDALRPAVILYEMYIYKLHELERAKRLIERLLKSPDLSKGQISYFKKDLAFIAEAEKFKRARAEKGDGYLVDRFLNVYKRLRDVAPEDREKERREFELAAFYLPQLKRPENVEQCCWVDLFYTEALFELNLPDAHLEAFITLLKSDVKNTCAVRAYARLKEYAGARFVRGGYPKHIAGALEEFRSLDEKAD